MGQSLRDKSVIAYKAMAGVLSWDKTIEVVRNPEHLDTMYGLRTYSNGQIRSHGLVPSFSVKNLSDDLTILGVLGTKTNYRNLCVYFSPSVISYVRRVTGQYPDSFPVWFIFADDISNDFDCRSEVEFWFKGREDNVYFWEDMSDDLMLGSHFLSRIFPMLIPKK